MIVDDNGNLYCPFCGGKVDPEGWVGAASDERGEPLRKGPECDSCGATTPDLATWNFRAPAMKSAS